MMPQRTNATQEHPHMDTQPPAKEGHSYKKIVVVGYGIPGSVGTKEDDERAKTVFRALMQIFPSEPPNPGLLLIGPIGIVDSNVSTVHVGQSSMIAAQLMARDSEWMAAQVYCLELSETTPSILPWLHAFKQSAILSHSDQILETITSNVPRTESPAKKREALQAVWTAVMNDLDHKKEGAQA